MFIERMDNEFVGCIHNGYFCGTNKIVVQIQILSYKKDHIWVSSNEADEPGAYYTEWSKSERERQVLYINTYT